MQIPVRELSMADRAGLERHFLALGPEDRRLRFGAAIGDATVRAYVKRIAFDRDTVFGVGDDNLLLLGVAHLARLPGAAELGISVLNDHRLRGVGGALMARAVMRARNVGLRTVFMHCLAENDAIPHLARKLSMAETVLSELRRKGKAPGIVFLDNQAHPERVVVRMK